MFEFTFPDSGRTVKMERVGFTTLSLLRAHYEQATNHKPVVPQITLDGITEDNPNDPNYKEAKQEWDSRVAARVWLATRMLYAKHVIPQSVDQEAVATVKQELADLGADLPSLIHDEYAKLQVPFNDAYLDAYIYLWHVCIQTSAESSLFHGEMSVGSKASQEAVQEALFRLRS